MSRMIPVLIGGPGHDQPHAMIASPLAGPIIFHSCPASALAAYPAAVEPLDEARYVRRGYRVGDTLLHAYVVSGITDAEAAGLMWRWVLDHAGVPDPA